MIDATMTRQNTIRERASAWRTRDRPADELATEDRRRHRLALDGGDDEAEAGERRRAGHTSRRARREELAPSRARVWWIETTSSAKLATANGPTVPSTMSPM